MKAAIYECYGPPEAHARVDTDHTHGNVVVSIAPPAAAKDEEPAQ